MKIIHVTAGLVRSGAGVREMIIELARSQIDLGADVEVVGLDHLKWEEEKSDWDGITALALPVTGPRSFGYAPTMTETLVQKNPDIVHLHGLWLHPGRSVLQWSRQTGRPYVLSPHGMLSPIALRFSRLKKMIASRLFQKTVFDKASALLVTSEQELIDARLHGLQQSIYIIPNGVKIKQTMPQKGPHQSRTILSLGRVHSIKGLDQLIQAWVSLEKEFADWRLLIVGPDEGGETARLLQLVAKLGLSRVDFQGAVYGDEKTKLLAEADIFALPSRSENFAMTVSESLMLGVPVVASKGAPWAGLDTEDCGRWVDYGAPFMEEALRELMLLEPAQRKEMGERGRQWMTRDFTWPEIAKKSYRCYQNILELY